MQKASASPWKNALERLWVRLKLGTLPEGGRDDRWTITVDGRTVTFCATPDERALLVAVEAMRLDGDVAQAEIPAILRRDLGFLHGASGGLRLAPDGRGSVLLVEDAVPTEASDADVDRVIEGLLERAAVHASATRRAAPAARPAPRSRMSRDDDADIIFRP